MHLHGIPYRRHTGLEVTRQHRLHRHRCRSPGRGVRRYLLLVLWLLPVSALGGGFTRCADDTLTPNNRINACTIFLQAAQTATNIANAYSNRGVAHHHKGEYHLAITDYNRALKQAPGNAHTLNNRGSAYQALGNIANAMRDYDRALRLHPRLASAYNNRGNIYRGDKQYERALDDYNNAIQIEPQMAIAFYNRAYTYRLQEQFDKAVDDYNRAIQLNADYVKAYIGRGRLFSLQGEYQSALDDYNQALRIDPENPYAYNNRGDLHRQQNRLADAVRNYQKAIELLPRNAEFYNNLAWLLATTSESYSSERAIDLAQRAIQLNTYGPNRRNAVSVAFHYDTLAAAYAKIGHFDHALEAQQRAIDKMRESGAEDYIADMEYRLKLYQKRHPYIEKASDIRRAEKPREPQ